MYATAIIFFTFFYVSIIFNTDEVANNLRKNGAFIPGIRPGKRTADYLNEILTRLTTAGAIYLAVVALLPQFVPAGSNPLAVGLLLAAVHGLLSIAWFALLTSLATVLSRWLRRPVTTRVIDGITGTALVGFGMRLAVAGR